MSEKSPMILERTIEQTHPQSAFKNDHPTARVDIQVMGHDSQRALELLERLENAVEEELRG